MALVDASGQPLTFTIGAGRDAFFNLTDGQATALADGVVTEGPSVRVDLAYLPGGAEARLVIRLVNNDFDGGTSVAITDVRLVAVAPASRPLPPPGLESSPPNSRPAIQPTPIRPSALRQTNPPNSLLEEDSQVVHQIAPPPPPTMSRLYTRHATSQLLGDDFERADGSVGNGWSRWLALDRNPSLISLTNGALRTWGSPNAAGGIYRNQPTDYPVAFSFEFWTPLRDEDDHCSSGLPPGVGNQGGWAIYFNADSATDPPYGRAQVGFLMYGGTKSLVRVSGSDDQRVFDFLPRQEGQRNFTADSKATIEGVVAADLSATIRIHYNDGQQPESLTFCFDPVASLPPAPGNAFVLGNSSCVSGPYYFDSLQVAEAQIPSITLTIDSPRDGAQLPTGQPVLLSGRVEGLPPGYPPPRVNGTPVDAMDGSGRFFAVLDLKPGPNEFKVTANDDPCRPVSATLHLTGVDSDGAQVDSSSLIDASSSVVGVHGRTSFHNANQHLLVDLAIHNTGQYAMRSPLVVGLRNFSDPTVRIINADGLLPDGTPYFDFTALASGDVLGTGGTTGFRSVAFSTPSESEFTYELVVLGQLNRAPAFTSVPRTESNTGQAYHYAAVATDPDGDTVEYSLVTGPAAMAIDPETGQLGWLPTPPDAGSHHIVIRASDGRGGTAEQGYVLSASAPSPNRPPYFTSVPVTHAIVSPWPSGSFEIVSKTDDIRLSNSQQPSIAPTLFVDPDQQIHVVFTEGPHYGSGWYDDLRYARIALDATILIPAKPLALTGRQANATIIAKQGEGIHIAWHGLGPAPTEEVYHTFLSADGTAHGVTQLTSTPTRVNTDLPQLAPGQGDVAYLVFQDEVNDPIDGDANRRRDVFFQKLRLVGTTMQLVGPRVELTTAEGVGFRNVGFVNNLGNIAVDGRDRVHVVWADWRNSSNPDHTEIYYERVDENGNTIIYEIPVSLPDLIRSGPPRVQIDNASIAHVLWTEDRTGMSVLLHARIDESGKVVDRRELITGPTNSISSVSFALDDLDRLHVVRMDLSDGDARMLYQRFDQFGNLLVSPLVITRSPGSAVLNSSYRSIDVAAGGRFTVVWTDTRDGNEEVYIKSFMVQELSQPSYLYDAEAVDPDSDPLQFSIVAAPSGTQINANSGLVTWAPSVDQIGTHNVTVEVSDGRGGIATQSYLVTVLADPANHPPIIISQPVTNAVAGGVYTYDVEAVDPDNDALTYSLTSGPAGMTIREADGVIQWTAPSVTESNLPFAPGFEVGVYVAITNPFGLTYAPDGVFFVGIDQGELPIGDPSGPIRRVAVGGSAISTIGDGLADPDAVAFDAAGVVSGTPGAILVGGLHTGYGSDTSVRAVLPSAQIITLWGPTTTFFNPTRLLFDDTGRLLFAAGQGGGAPRAIFVTDSMSGFPQVLFTYEVRGNGSFALDEADRIYTVALQDDRGTPATEDDLWKVQIHDHDGNLLDGSFVAGLSAARRDPLSGLMQTTWLEWRPAHGAFPGGLYLLHNGDVFSIRENGQWYPVATGFGGYAREVRFGPDGALYAAMGNGDNRILRLMPLPDVEVRVDDGRGGFDTQRFAAEVTLPCDLTIANIDKGALVYDGQALAASGTVTATITNRGPGRVDGPFEVLFFEDRNLNGVYDNGVDSILGTTSVSDSLQAGQGRVISAQLAGSVLFPGNVVWGFVDSGNAIVETDETNNLASSGTTCQTAPIVGEFDPVVEWRTTSFTALPEFVDVLMTPAVVDLDRNGIPDIVFTSLRRNAAPIASAEGVLRAVEGETGRELWTVQDAANRLEALAGVAVGDIDNDSYPEIVAVSASRTLIVFEHDGQLKWRSPVRLPSSSGLHQIGCPAIADLNQDGVPEVIFGNLAFNADGSLRWDGGANGGQGIGDNGFGPVSLVADIDMDGRPEVVAGKSTYRFDGSVYWNSSITDGFPGIANLDDDAYPEIVLVTGGSVYALEHTGAVKWGPTAVPGGGRGGPPTLADVDGDGQLEIGIAGADRYVVLETDGSVKWQRPIQDSTSNATGSTAFDFDGDGNAEIVYGDELHLWIFAGANGSILHSFPKSSCTTYEYPLVADVDADGNAEILAVANGTCGFGTDKGIMVLGSASDSWVSTRQIWNQHTYHINNVNDDGTIPRYETNSWQTHNTYRLNAFADGFGPLSAPDLVACYLRVATTGQVSSVTARVGNAGAILAPSGVNVAFYNGQPGSGGALLGVVKTMDRMPAGAFEDVTIVLTNSVTTDVWVVADGAGAYGFSVFDVPGAEGTAPLGINSVGQIVGQANYGGLTPPAAFLRDGSDFNTFSVPGATLTTGIGLNDLGQVVGLWTDGSGFHPFVTTVATFGTVTPFEIPGFEGGNTAYDINMAGEIVGHYNDAAGSRHAYRRYQDGSYETIDYPGAADSWALGNNDHGDIVGQWTNERRTDGRLIGSHGWLRDADGVYSSLDAPDSVGTAAFGANNAGQIVGTFEDAAGLRHGFVRDTEGTLARIDMPGAVRTDVRGISDSGMIIGSWVGPDGRLRGFVATPVGNVRECDEDNNVFNPMMGGPLGEIHGTVYEDLNGDGRRTIGDAPGSGEIWLPELPTLLEPGRYPSVVRLPDGRIRMYYDHFTSDARTNSIYSAISTDGGHSWVGEGIRFHGNSRVDGVSHAMEANVKVLADGTYRMYFDELDPNSGMAIYHIASAVSTDGLTWTREPGERIPSAAGGVMVGSPEVVNLPDGRLRMYFSGSPAGGTTAGVILSATSSDGITWTKEDGVRLSSGDARVLWSPSVVELKDGRLRMYYTGGAVSSDQNVFSALSPNGLDWVEEPGIRLDGSDASISVGGATVESLGAGALRMYFVQWVTGTSLGSIRSAVNFEEDTVPGRVVWIDADLDGVHDSGERSVVSDASGNFVFRNLPPGAYALREAMPFAWVQTAPEAEYHMVTLTDGQVVTGIDFGSQRATGAVSNRVPLFSSAPPNSGVVGQALRYAAHAIDADGDALTFDLTLSSPGMAVHSSSGIVVWTPSSSQVGPHDVILRVQDGRGGVAVQSFTITVSAENTTPVITSRPTGPAAVGNRWQYQVRAQDADGDTIAFSLAAGPAAMTANPTSGLVEWTPGAGDVGAQHIAVSASDSRGATTTQSFDLPVVAVGTNLPPVINSVPRGSVRLGGNYQYQVVAADPNGDPLTYRLATNPDGMSIDGTGLVSWVPTVSQLGTNAVDLQVDDGHGGVVGQRFSVVVLTSAVNAPPSVTSTPPQAATVGVLYAYDLRGSDPDGDALSWSLETAPAGMSVNSSLGTIRWTPTLDQLGTNAVVVRTGDAQGGFATQSFAIVVRSANLPPQVTSSPPTRAATNDLYTYAVRAVDPEGEGLSFALLIAPTNMTMDAASGLIEWIPNQLGTNQVVLQVTDSHGAAAQQDYRVVVADNLNNYPIITSTPTYAGLVGSEYRYQVTATDSDGDTLSFALLNGPAGMAVDATSGVLAWTPTAAQLGTHPVAVGAADPFGAGGSQSFTVQIFEANATPTVASSPVQVVDAGRLYRYDIRASDPDGDTLRYSLTGPAGMTIDQFGRVSWQTTLGDAGVHRIEITVADPIGASVTQTFDLAVVADTTPPQIHLVHGTDRFPVGTILEISAFATDNVGVTSLTITFGGAPVLLDASGRAELTLGTPGTFTLLARAVDATGNVGQDSFELTVLETVVDPEAPVVAITSPADDALITSPVDVIGTASDANLVAYTLSVAPHGTSEFRPFHSSSNGVVDGVLGRLDPSTMANDTYVLRLEALDAGGLISTIESTIHVAGDLKIGNFTLSFVDLSIPVNGIPITVGRTYDSLNASRSADFGHGWRLEFRDVNLRNSLPERTATEVDFGLFSGFTERTRVYVTVPGGRRVGFTFRPTLMPGFASIFGFYKPAFVPDTGVTSSLTVPSGPDIVLRYNDSTGTYDGVDGFGGTVPYNPDDPAFGGEYTLTTKEGLIYEINAETRQLTRVGDPNGNILTFSDSAIVSSAGPRIAIARDPQGRITSVTDPAGRSVRYQYDARGDLVAVTDRESSVTQFAYSTSRPHFLEQVIDPLGRTGVRSEYDAQGRLARLIDADGNAVRLLHDPDNSIEQVVDSLGNTNTFEYDDRGNVVTEVNALGAVTRREYDLNNNLTVEVDPLGHTNRFTYDADGNVLARTDSLGSTTINSYSRITPRGWFNFNGRTMTLLSTSTDPLGNTTRNDYDGAGNLTASTDALGNTTRYAYDGAGNQTTITDVAGNITRFEYDGAGHLLRQTDALGNATVYAYDANGNQLSQTTVVTIRPGEVRTNITFTTYDANGRPTSSTDAAGNTTHTEYDALGNTEATIDALGHRTEFRYDDRGKLIETVFADGTRSSLTYDAAGRRISSTDRAGRTTHFEYDPLGRLISTIYPDDTPADLSDNPYSRTFYDLTGRVIVQTDERTNSTWFGYDAAGRQIAVTNALGSVTRSAYDAAGRKISDTDALGRSTQFGYDALGRRIQTLFADATAKRTLYDALGRVIAEVDQAGITNRFEYDALGRLTAVVDALGGRTEYAYNEGGNLVRQQDANGHVTRYEYETCCQRSATILPLGQQSTTLYNAVNSVSAITDFNGRTSQFDYDVNNRLQTKRFPDGTTVAFAYTPTGRRQRVTEPRGVTTFEYDARDRLLRRTDPDGRFVAYTYDAAGNRTSVTTVTGTTRYEYDALNRLTRITDPEGGITRYTYDLVNNVVLQELPNGTVRANAYDGLNRVDQIEHRGSGGAFARYEYTLGPTGNRVEVRELDGRRVTYAYDALHRLTQETIADPVSGPRTIGYVMDAVGNRLVRNDSVEGQTTNAYDANDQLLTETLAGVTTSYTYDANGNTLSRSSTTESTEYEWNPENRLIGFRRFDASHAPVSTGQFQYDTDGIRVSSTVTEGGNTTATAYLIDANRPFAQVIEELQTRNSEPGTLVTYTYGHHQPISQNRAGVRTYYHADHLGSTRALTGQTGSLTDRYAFDAYGRTLRQTGPTGNDYLFAGEQRDRHLGLDYLRARYLSVGSGRLVSRDSFGGLRSAPPTLNRFLYGNGDPVNNSDPSGNISLSEVVTVSIIVPILYLSSPHPVFAAPQDPCANILSGENDPAGIVERVLIAEAELKNEEFLSGQYERGLRLVGSVIQNRWKDSGFWAHAGSIKGVVEMPGQFEGFHPYPPRLNKVSSRLKDFCNLAAGAQAVPIYTKALTKARAVAKDVVSQNVTDEFSAEGGTYYLWTHGYPLPDWLEGRNPLAEDITGSDFYTKP